MGSELPVNTSQTARLILGGPSMAVGWQGLVRVPDPAAGEPWKYTVDGRYYERLIMARWYLDTSAAVATRYMEFELRDQDDSTVFLDYASGGVTASNQVRSDLSIGCPVLASGTAGDSPGWLPDILVPPGWSWNGTVYLMDAADQLSHITLVVQRFPTDAAVMDIIG